MRAGRLFHAIVVLGASGAGLSAGCDGAMRASPGAGRTTGGASGRSSTAAGGTSNAAGGKSGATGDVPPLYDDDGGVVDAGDPISLGGFGGASEPEGVFWPTSCDHPYQYVCDSYQPLAGCRCDPSRPRGAEDCGGVRKTRCSEFNVRDPKYPYDPLSMDVGYVDCVCVPEDVASPAECEGFGQYVCAVDVNVFRDCHCDPTRPLGPAACDKPEDFFCAARENGSNDVADCACGAGDIEASCPEDGSHRFSCQSYDPPYGCLCQYTGIK